MLVDGAQAVPHLRVDVQDLDCDFFAFSGHKVYGPMGIGALYGREKLLDAMPPWMGGGEMIRSVSMETSTWNDLPWKFEAGTPNVEGAVGLSAAIDYLHALGLPSISAWESELAAYARERLGSAPSLTLYGSAPPREAAFSPSPSATSTRTTWPSSWTGKASRSAPATTARSRWRGGSACRPRPARASSFYNTFSEIDRLVEALEGALRFYA